MEYQKAVAEARLLVRRRKEDRDQLIQLTAEVLLLPGITYQQWADDIGVGKRSVVNWVRYVREAPADTYDDWRRKTYGEDEDHRAVVRLGSQPPEEKAEIVRQWLADDDGGRTRAEVGRVLHQHDTDTERHITRTRQARANEGERPDFETTESVQRVLADIAQLEVDAGRLPAALSDRSKSLLSYAFGRVKATVDYYADAEHEHGLSDDELAQFFGGQS